MKSWLILVCLFLVDVVRANDFAGLDPDQPYSAKRLNPVTYDAEMAAIVTAPYKTKLLRVWVPVPQSDRGQEVLSSSYSTFPVETPPSIAAEPVFGNRFAYFEFHHPQGAQIIRQQLRIRVWELRWDLAPARVTHVTEWPASFEIYRRGEGQAVVTNSRLENLLKEIVPVRQGSLTDLASVMTWADKNLIYDHSAASLRASSLHALENRSGHCSDYHGFCAALGRLMDLPTRVTYGINTFPKTSPSHCKLEAFLPPYGWVSFDVSETQKLSNAIRSNGKFSEQERDELLKAARRRLLHGFRDNTWFVQTRGTDYELSPRGSKRVPVVRTIYAEADGKPLPDPDPSSADQTQFAWMNAQRFTPDVPARYPFTDLESLREWVVIDSSSKSNSGDK